MVGSVDFVFPNGLHAAMPVEDAAGLRSFVRERTNVSCSLHSKLSTAVRERGGQVRLASGEPDELRRVLEAIDGRGDLTDAERDLRDAVRGYFGGTAVASTDDSEF